MEVYFSSAVFNNIQALKPIINYLEKSSFKHEGDFIFHNDDSYIRIVKTPYTSYLELHAFYHEKFPLCDTQALLNLQGYVHFLTTKPLFPQATDKYLNLESMTLVLDQVTPDDEGELITPEWYYSLKNHPAFSPYKIFVRELGLVSIGKVLKVNIFPYHGYWIAHLSHKDNSNIHLKGKGIPVPTEYVWKAIDFLKKILNK